MDVVRIEEMKGGWFAGNFEPTAWKTEAFEAAVHDYKKGEEKEAHYHKLGTEINLLLEGSFILRNYDGKGTDQKLIISPGEDQDGGRAVEDKRRDGSLQEASRFGQ